MNEELNGILIELRQKRKLQSIEIASRHNLRKDLGLDSVDIVVLAIQLQEKFNIDIFQGHPCQTVADIESHIKK